MSLAPVALGLFQGRRLARHPLVLAGAVLSGLLLQYGLREPPGGALAALTQAVPFYLGPSTFLAAYLSATTDRRARSGDLVDAAPVPARVRAAGALAGVLGPVTVAACLVGTAGMIHAASRGGSAPVGPADIASAPLVVCGAGLLGVATAYWIPWRGGAALVLAGLVLWCFAGRVESAPQAVAETLPWQLLTPYVELLHPDTGARLPGSMVWHDAYLVCLNLLAAVAALLATPGPRRRLLVAAVALAGGAALAGWRQLP